MAQEDKQLLFVALCAMLPYHVRLKVWLKDGTIEEGFLDLEHNYADVLRDAFYYNEIKDIKPYLRLMSSMTETERQEYGLVLCNELSVNRFDWLNAHHFDYRNLIGRGLAIDCTDLNVY